MNTVSDTFGRRLRDLRISVTDRCNFRCCYCMPRDVFGADFPFMKSSELLTFEEIDRLTKLFAGLGVRKVRLTGGEPLLRHGIERLVEQLIGIDGIDEVAMTTNGSLLAKKARTLRDAGLGRVTVSLDSLDPEIFRAMSDVKLPLDRVIEGIAAAAEAGLTPVKINTVIKRGVNDGQGILDLAAFGRDHGYVVRFIEFMDVGATNGWQLDEVVPAAEIVNTLNAVWPIEPLDANYVGEVAARYRYLDGAGEVGVITSITQPFCGSCTRARLSAKGELYTCLFAGIGHDLRGPLRDGATDEELLQRITGVWKARTDRYSSERTTATVGLPKVEMSYIGG
ncbi:MAG: GTP 3',8-cyclase MoaA [Pseudonocardiales bacterium]|nr:GTP 3',8-cyclase MoaA [Pseudonocardiales bacterium]MBV9648701.1 GTP 3',8-cyclase MoaA [Pseudonocardiales bacterium]